MKTVTVDIYEFNELQNEAQNRVVERNRDMIIQDQLNIDNFDYRKSLDEFESTFGIKARYNLYGFRFEYNPFPDIEPEDCKGRLLWRWLNKKREDMVHRKKYYGWETASGRGKRPQDTKERMSRISYWLGGGVCGDLSLTGVYSDYALLKPIDEWMAHPDKDTSAYDLMERCIADFRYDWDSNDEGYDDDYVHEVLSECDENYYYEDGTRYNGPRP